MNNRYVYLLYFALFISCQAFANNIIAQPPLLQKTTHFFRTSYDNISMPNDMANMGLLGVTYYADFTPYLYGGIGGYGSVTGNQGGLFVLGFGAGLHAPLFKNLWGDAGLFVGGGGGRSSLVGGGLMLKPYIGLAYGFDNGLRFGLHYSFITFPSGLIRSKQIGVDLDIPFDFYSIPYPKCPGQWFNSDKIKSLISKCFGFSRNDFAITASAYFQKPGTKNVENQVQDGTIGLVGAELDHYMTEKVFWYLKADGAFRGIPNGYMDVLGGFGWHHLFRPNLAFVAQLGAGAGGGGNVDTGGGVLIQPQLGLEWLFSSNFSARLSGGYLWAPKGQLKAITAMGALIYHLDIGTEQGIFHSPHAWVTKQGWRIHLFNQTYLHPQRAHWDVNSNVNLIAFQIDQVFTPLFFIAYQATSSYQGEHTGGYATGMIGPGLQTMPLWHDRIQLFTELLIGAGGGGDLALSGGAIIEPVVGIHFAFNNTFGMQASASQLKALNDNLNTTVFGVGFTARFGTLNRG